MGDVLNSNPEMSLDVKIIADKVINEALERGNNENSIKKYYISIGDALLKNGVPPREISLHVLEIMRARMKKSSSQFSQTAHRYLCAVMQEKGWTKRSIHYNRLSQSLEPLIPTTVTLPNLIPIDEEFEILNLLGHVSKNNRTILLQLSKKLIYDRNVILKHNNSKVDSVVNGKVKKAIEKIENTRSIIKKGITEFADDNKKTIKYLSHLITTQEKIFVSFNARDTITEWQKMMALLSVLIGYEKNDIARLLKITTRHMKINIYDKKDDMLMLLHWFDRCPNPNCGVNLSEYFGGMIKKYRSGRSIENINDYDVEPLIASGYQKEILKLIIENKKLKSTITNMQRGK